MSIEDQLVNLRSLYTDEVVEQIIAAAVQSAGVVAIARERLRQMTDEGYLSRHDDQHPGEMAAAGAHYGFNASFAITNAYEEHERASVPAGWPWGAKAWKPKTPERDIERGGALLAAEYDSLKRRPACDQCGGSRRVDAPPPYEPGTLPCPRCGQDQTSLSQAPKEGTEL